MFGRSPCRVGVFASVIVLYLVMAGPQAAAAIGEGWAEPPRVILEGVTADSGPPRRIERTDGLVVDEGFKTFFSIAGGWHPTSSTIARARVRYGPGGASPDLEIRQLFFAIRFGAWTLEAGRGTKRLGRGERGRLLLDDDAPAFDRVEIRTEESVRLPGFLSTLGTFRFEASNGVLPRADERPEDPRFLTEGNPVARPNLFTMRAAFAPATWIEVGASRTVLYGGDGREAYDTFGEWWDLLTAHNENRESPDEDYGGDQLASVDLEIAPPWLRDRGPLKSVRYWIEYGGTDIHAAWQGDDTNSIWPFVLTDVAVLTGGEVEFGASEFYVEHVRIHEDWYRHSAYPQGYTNGGYGLGHAIGADARRWLTGGRWKGARGTTIEAWMTWDSVGRSTVDERSYSTWQVAATHEIRIADRNSTLGMWVDGGVGSDFERRVATGLTLTLPLTRPSSTGERTPHR